MYLPCRAVPRAWAFSARAAPLLVCILVPVITVAVCCAKESVPQTGTDEATVVNPHFTGRHCAECHAAIPDPGDRNLHIRFEGDDVALCNSCHDNKKARGDLHPVGIIPPEEGAVQVPQEFPLPGGRITCLTCHDVYLQCRDIPERQLENPDFLRGAPYGRSIDVCFRCHDRTVYKKTNPHEQRNADGTVQEQQCLYCHQSLPDTDAAAAIHDVTFKSQNAAFCSACHGREEHFHPAGAEHLLEPPESMLSAIAESEDAHEVILPLFEGRIFCGTCHNPHAAGIIARKRAAAGAGADKKLRLEPTRDLCIACHREKDGRAPEDIQLEDILLKNDVAPVAAADDGHAYHKSFLEQKCRACHRVTRDAPERPVVSKMCFQADCHDTSLVSDTYRHEKAVQADCLLCHSPHASSYSAHIMKDQQKLCKACHPLLSGTKRQPSGDEPAGDNHDYYFGLFSRLLPDEQMTCSYCHGQDHSAKAHDTGIVPCFQCHNYIESIIRENGGRISDIHESLEAYRGSRCTLCHDPHSSPHPALLKKERDCYGSR